jgi:hypothetical protein
MLIAGASGHVVAATPPLDFSLVCLDGGRAIEQLEHTVDYLVLRQATPRVE